MKAEKQSNPLLEGSILLTFFTGLLYAVGANYDDRFHAYFNIQHTLVRSDTADLIHTGYVLLSTWLMTWPAIAFVAACLLAYFLFRRFAPRRFAPEARRRIGIGLIIAAAVLLSHLTTRHSDDYAEWLAAQFRTHAIAATNSVFTETEEFKGYVILSNANAVAILTSDLRVRVIQRERITKIETTPPAHLAPRF